MKNLILLFVILFTTTFFSCQKDHEIVEPATSSESIDPKRTGTYHEETLTDLIPAKLLEKIQNEELLTTEERIDLDRISFDHVTYKGQQYNLTQVHEEARLFDNFTNSSATLLLDREIYLFDSQEELETFTATNANARGGSWGFKVRFWEHVNYNGAMLEYRYSINFNDARAVGFVFPSWWINRASSIVADDIRVDNGGPRDDVRVDFLQNEGYSFYHTLDPGDVKAIHDLRYICPSIWNCGSNWNDKLVAVSMSQVEESVVGLNDFEDLLIGAGNTLLLNIINNPSDDGVVVMPNFSNYVLIQGVPEQWKKVYATSANQSNVAFGDYDGTQKKWIASSVFKSGKAMPYCKFTSLANQQVMDHHLITNNIYTHPYHGGDNQHWVILKYYKWWWSAPEYKIINVQTGRILTRGQGSNNNVWAHTSFGYRDEAQRWRMPLQ